MGQYLMSSGPTAADPTRREPTILSLANVISGWQLGIPEFKKEGKGTLLIPSALAYGSSGRGSIPPNTVLAFDIELLDF